MLKTSGILRLTLRENLRGQLLWSSAISGSVLLILLTTLSGVALSHESRVIDVFSYFAADQLLLFVSVLSGSSICATDFSSRGLAELYIPAGTPRQNLYLTRLFAYSVVTLTLAMTLYGIKILLLPRLAESPRSINYEVQFTMLFFSWLKSLTALAISGFFGCLVRPIYSVLATITLFSFGHLTASFDSLLNSSSTLNSEQHVSQTSAFLYYIFKIWNPNLLVVDSAKGAWIQPSFEAFQQGITWALGFIFIATALAFVRISRIDVRP